MKKNKYFKFCESGEFINDSEQYGIIDKVMELEQAASCLALLAASIHQQATPRINTNLSQFYEILSIALRDISDINDLNDRHVISLTKPYKNLLILYNDAFTRVKDLIKPLICIIDEKLELPADACVFTNDAMNIITYALVYIPEEIIFGNDVSPIIYEYAQNMPYEASGSTLDLNSLICVIRNLTNWYRGRK